jgi:uncharacterized membrane protein
MLKVFWTIVRILFALFMVYAGVQHFVKPDFYIPFVPSFLPFTKAIIYVSGLIEVILGLMLFIPKYIKIGALGIMFLMFLFLPIHVWDVFSDTPAIGSSQAALIRLPIQFLFIAIAWKIKDQ